MNAWLIFYLIGVVAGLSLVFIANRNVNIKTWKTNILIRSLLYTLLSWVFVFIVAIKGIIENS